MVGPLLSKPATPAPVVMPPQIQPQQQAGVKPGTKKPQQESFLSAITAAQKAGGQMGGVTQGKSLIGS